MRYFGGHSYKKTAREAGMTERALTSFYHRIDIPRDLDCRKFGDAYDDELAKANLARSGYELAVCRRTDRFFWRHRDDRATVHCNRETRRAMGPIGEYESGGVEHWALDRSQTARNARSLPAKQARRSQNLRR